MGYQQEAAGKGGREGREGDWCWRRRVWRDFCEFGDMTDLLSRLSVMKSTVAGLEEDQKHEVAMKFINDLLR
jgi:hypothetical protein